MPWRSSDRLEPVTSNYEKYGTQNPIMRRIIERFLERVAGRVREWQPRRVVDLGCGEGVVAGWLHRLPIQFEYLGVEQNPWSVDTARADNPGLRFEVMDFVAGEARRGWADLAICLEVLEHLDDPQAALRKVLDWTSRYALVSVPWEPYFRLGNFVRGRHLIRLGNHPEHVQQFGPRALRELLLVCSDRAWVETCFPWLIGILEKPPRA